MERDSGSTGKRLGGAFGEAGATAVEYAILVSAIAMVIMVGVTSVGGSVQGMFGGATDALDGATPARGEGLASTPVSSGGGAGPVEAARDAPSLTGGNDAAGTGEGGTDADRDDECRDERPGNSGATAACENRRNDSARGDR